MKRLCWLFFVLLLSSLAFGDEIQDSASIKGCQDPVLTVTIQRGRSEETVMLIVNDTWRGSYKEGKSLQAVWGGEKPGMGGNWIVMGHVEDDGYFHVHPEVRYPFDRDKGSWVQAVLKE